MERIGMLAVLQARPGREHDVIEFLKSAQPLAQSIEFVDVIASKRGE